MPGEALLGFLSGMMKKKEEKFKEELKRKADLNAIFEEIKLRNKLETEAEKNKPQEFETWIHKKTGKSISVPKTANALERTSFETQGYVPESTYDKVKEKIPFDKLPEEFKQIIPYFQSLDQDLQEEIYQTYIEEKLRQQKLVHPTSTKPETKEEKGLLAAIKKAQSENKKPQQAGALPSLSSVLQIPKSVADKINSTTMIRKPTTKPKAKVSASQPLRDIGLVKKKDGYWTPRYVDTIR